MEKNTATRSNKVMISVFLLIGIIATTGFVMWGRSDVGQIDVSATIANSGLTESQNGNAPVMAQPASAVFQNMPNGGLVPQSEDAKPAPTPEPEATTTDETTASTTEEQSATNESGNQEQPTTKTEETTSE